MEQQPRKPKTLKELAEEGEVLMEDLPDNPESNAPVKRRGLPSEGVTSNAMANVFHCGGLDGFG